MTTSTRRKSAIANAKWILSQRVSSSGEVLRFGTVLSDNVAAQNGTDGQGLFSFRSVTSTFDSDGPWGKFNWNFLLGVILATGVSAIFWAGVAIFLSGVLR
jgi:hypothetical protein